jgi:hypothetical protein
VVEIEFGTLGPVTAVLTGELVAGKDIDSAITHVALGNSVEAR